MLAPPKRVRVYFTIAKWRPIAAGMIRTIEQNRLIPIHPETIIHLTENVLSHSLAEISKIVYA
jgi:hypothetical protein